MNSAPGPVQFPVIDSAEADRFLSIFGTDLHTFQTFDDSGQKRPGLERILHGTREANHAALVDLQRGGAGVYVTINETDFRGRKTENIVRVRAYAADFDGTPTTNGTRLNLLPTAVIESSPGRCWAVYTVTDAPLGNFKPTQRRLAALFDSDPAINDLPRVMRLPGFVHQKDPNKPFMSRIHYLNPDARYTDAQFQAALAEAEVRHPPPKPVHVTPAPLAPRSFGMLGDMREPAPPETQYEVNKLRSALQCLDPSYEPQWRRVLCGIKTTGWSDETVLFIADEWSQRTTRNNYPGRDGVWAKLSKISADRNGITERTIYADARAGGWSVPAMQLLPTPQPAQSTDRLFCADSLMSKPVPERQWIAKDWVPRGETTLLAGDGGSGKTTLAIQLAVACATSTEWLGIKVEPVPVLYVSAEDPTAELHFRLAQIRKQQPISLAALHFLDLAGEPATIATFDKDGKIRLTELFTYIENAARERSAGLVIFDAAADFFGGNENDRSEVRAFIGALRGLAMRLNAAIVIVAHPSVDGIKTGRGYSGSTHWNNGVRSRLTFTKPEKTDKDPNPDPDARVLELSKSNRARAGEQIHMRWTAGAFERITLGMAFNPVVALNAERVFLELLDKLAAQKRHVSNSRSSTFAPTELAKLPGGKELGKAALEAAMNRLFEKGTIYVAEDGPPSKRRHFIARRQNSPSG